LHCPLCRSTNAHDFYRDARRQYYRCDECQLVYVDSKHYLSVDAERAEYDKHENSASDEGYRRFLSRIANPLMARVAPNSKGLDFGCGPGPALAEMLKEAGHQVELFDLYYANNPKVWSQQYDFICATEVIEHLSRPDIELARLWSHVSPKGVLAIMTKLVIDQQRFATWHYKNDPTHICFYSCDTFDWLADKWMSRWTAYADDAFIFERY